MINLKSKRLEKLNLFIKYVPNSLTVLRIILSIILLVRFNIQNNFDEKFILILFIILFTDKLDGVVARRFRCISDFGKIVDPIADKIFCFSILIIFYKIKLIPIWGVAIMVSKDIVLTVYRYEKLKRGIIISSFKLGKYKVAYNMIIYTFIIMLLYSQKTLSAEVYQIIKVIILTTIL